MPPQTGSPRIYTNDTVSQKDTSLAHDTDGRARLLNNGNSGLPLPCDVCTSSRSQFILLKDVETKSSEVIGLLTKRHVHNFIRPSFVMLF